MFNFYLILFIYFLFTFFFFSFFIILTLKHSWQLVGRSDITPPTSTAARHCTVAHTQAQKHHTLQMVYYLLNVSVR